MTDSTLTFRYGRHWAQQAPSKNEAIRTTGTVTITAIVTVTGGTWDWGDTSMDKGVAEIERATRVVCALVLYYL